MKQIIPVLLIFIIGCSQLSGQLNNQNQGGEIKQISEETDTQSLFQVKKNSVFIEFFVVLPGIGYSRIVPISQNVGLVVTGAITPFYGWVTELDAGLIMGNNKHFFEPVAGYWFVADNAYLKLGYRYQASKGFMLRISPAWSFTESTLMWTASFGYSF